MSRHQPRFEKWQQRFAVMFIASVGFGLATPLSIKAQATSTSTAWIVTINLKDGDPPTYTAQKNGNCMYPVPTGSLGAYTLTICPTDTISWNVVTSSGTHDVIIFLEPLIFEEPGGSPTHFRKTHDAVPTKPVTPDSEVNPDDSTEYNYCVVVYERTTSGVLHVHDPKVIIGTGTRVGATTKQVNGQLKVLDKNAKEFVKQLQEAAKNPQFFKSEDAAKDVENDARKIQELIEEIKKKLAAK